MPDESPIEIGAIELTAEPPSADVEPPSSPRSRVRLVLLSTLLVVGVAGGAVLAYTGWQVATQKDAKLAAPAKVGTLTLDSSEDAKSTADYLQTAVAAEIDLDKTIGAVYQDSTSPQKDVLVFGGTKLFWAPENELDTAFDLVADNEGAVVGLHEVDAGKLGGTMKCGSTKTDAGDLTVCGWADHGSVALAMFNNRSETEAAGLLRQIRDATETR
ncbi:hypothetical protein [Paractinoplanes globisporus]|uniref:Uncharacterized protein n=1 Tax=Paractinoplanes globisporus TaxID=113565 RepID=A0ABW6WI70_9ACTN|nr:hypothetical protein [Actinoplanes globisporus]